MLSPTFGGLKSVCFREKGGLYAIWIPRRGKPMGGGLPADCGRKSIGFWLFLGQFMGNKCNTYDTFKMSKSEKQKWI